MFHHNDRQNEMLIKNFAFREYLNAIVHDWSRISIKLALILVPIFFILDVFTMPPNFLPKFAIYRSIATVIVFILYIIIKNTKPSNLSPIFGYLVSLTLGGVIAIMTVDLGGFSSGYYAGLNLVIIGVNLLIPGQAFHSAINGLMTIFLYIVLNLFSSNDIHIPDIINNLFFLCSTLIIAVSINHVRYKLIKQEYTVRTQLQSATEALWGEMEMAKKIQTTLLPKSNTIGPYELSAIMEPAAEIGGDYYDVIETNAGENWVMIGDVSGHGVESGLIMMMTQTSIFSLINNTPHFKPKTLIQYVNSVMRKNLIKLVSHRYMTLLAIKINETSITLAGKHQDLLIFRANTKKVEVMPIEGTWIGIADDVSEFLRDTTLEINLEDVILLFTDGATEATNSQGQTFTQEKLISLFETNALLSPKEIVKTLFEEIKAFQEIQTDDISLLALKRVR